MSNFTSTTYCPVNELDHTPDSKNYQQDHETRVFRERVEKEMKCKTCYRDGKSAWVYREGDSFTLGYLGFMDKTRGYKFGSGSSSKNTKYTCVSKNIVNWKYSSGQDQHHMAGSTNLDKAVKNAKRYFRPWSPFEIASISFGLLRREFSDVQFEVNQTYHLKLEEFTNSFTQKGDVFQEMGLLLSSDYDFKYPSVRDMIQKIHDALDDVKEKKKRDPIHKFVYIRDRMGKQEVGTFDIDASQHYFPPDRYNPEDITFVDVSEMDEELARKVSSLAHLKQNGYMDGIGFKAADNCYYVTK